MQPRWICRRPYARQRSDLSIPVECLKRLIEERGELFLVGTVANENGFVTYRSQGGDILHPSVMRAQKREPAMTGTTEKRYLAVGVRVLDMVDAPSPIASKGVISYIRVSCAQRKQTYNEKYERLRMDFRHLKLITPEPKLAD